MTKKKTWYIKWGGAYGIRTVGELIWVAGKNTIHPITDETFALNLLTQPGENFYEASPEEVKDAVSSERQMRVRAEDSEGQEEVEEVKVPPKPSKSTKTRKSS